MKQKIYSATILLCMFGLLLPLSGQADTSQPMQTAAQFFQTVSAKYAQLTDYEAQVVVSTSKTTMRGTVIYKSPSLMRMDFADPAEQIIIYNGEELVVYVPAFNAIMRQQTSGSNAGAAAIATGNGLRILGNSYTQTWAKSPAPEPLDANSEEMVVTMLLARRTVAEGFRQITLSINPETLLIRRMRGESTTGETITLDFLSIVTNTNISDSRFIYDTPSSANSYNNFLLNTGN